MDFEDHSFAFARILGVVEDCVARTLTMVLEPAEDVDATISRPLRVIFAEAHEYQVNETATSQAPLWWDMDRHLQADGAILVRIQTSVGFRQLICRSIRCEPLEPALLQPASTLANARCDRRSPTWETAAGRNRWRD
jgi:hypothetical protein